MLIAAHPDDESLACSVVFQRAVRAGAAVRVIYVTNGENNPWPQRVLERKWRLDESDRYHWGKLRQMEAIAALKVLGVDDGSASFLGLPDQALTEVLLSNPKPMLERLAEIIERWSPTDLLIPSLSDIHPDHSALGVMLQLIANKSPYAELGISIWSYLVHGNSRSFAERSTAIGQTAAEKAIKLRAIGCHQTQVRLFGKRFWRHAGQAERFLRLNSSEVIRNNEIISFVSRNPRRLLLKLERPVKVFSRRKSDLFVLGYDEDIRLRAARMEIPARTSAVEIRDLSTGRILASGRYRGGAFSGDLEIPTSLFSPRRPLFIKVQRRGWFFDEAGWLNLSVCLPGEATAPQEDWYGSSRPEGVALSR